MVSETEDEAGGREEKVNSRGEPEPMGPRLLDVRLRVGVGQVMPPVLESVSGASRVAVLTVIMGMTTSAMRMM